MHSGLIVLPRRRIVGNVIRNCQQVGVIQAKSTVCLEFYGTSLVTSLVAIARSLGGTAAGVDALVL